MLVGSSIMWNVVCWHYKYWKVRIFVAKHNKSQKCCNTEQHPINQKLPPLRSLRRPISQYNRVLFRIWLKLALRHSTIKTQRGRDGVAGGCMPGEALLRGPWAPWQRDPAKELCCDKSDSQPYFYSSINLIGRRKKEKASEPGSHGGFA